MSIQAVAWVLDQHPENLPGKPKLVLVSIANHADHTNGYCFLNLETISRESSMPVRSLYRYIGALVRNGYLRKVRRKGADGKHRATDYWILFQRAPAVFNWGAAGEIDDRDEPQDVVEPSASVADGENTTEGGRGPVESCELADGPSAIGGTTDKDEPSKTKPSYEEEGQGLCAAQAPRTYRPPPIEPMGAIVDPQGKQIFVIKGTRAWDAHLADRKRRTGISSMPTIWATINGIRKEGWYFSSLFPSSAAPDPSANLDDDDSRQLANL
jgi:hypothetical protein